MVLFLSKLALELIFVNSISSVSKGTNYWLLKISQSSMF